MRGFAKAYFANSEDVRAAMAPSLNPPLVHLAAATNFVVGSPFRVMGAKGHATVEATRDAEDRWVDHIAQLASRSLISKANTWYTGANIKGKPRIFSIYVAGLGDTPICATTSLHGVMRY